MFKIKRKSRSPSTPSLSGRCALCYGHPKQIGAFATYRPKDGGESIPYILCPNCASRTNGRLDQADLRKIEAYIFQSNTAAT